MSLTFDFPQWQVCVTSSQNEEKPAQRSRDNDTNDTKLDEDNDWAADLADLDGDEDAGAGLGERGVKNDVDPRPDSRPTGEVLAEDTTPSGLRSSPHDQPTWGPSGSPGIRIRSCEGGWREGAMSSPGSTAPRTGSEPAGVAQPSPSCTAPTGARPAPGGAVRGGSIPAEVLLLVLSDLRDVGDCVRAALVCKHWLSVVTLGNELWFELDSIQLAGGTWHRAPHAGRPLLRPPPGCDHPRSRMLSYKTTCALTQVAVRFMVLRKGFEYVVEAAAALWLPAQRAVTAAAEPQPPPPQQQQQPSNSGAPEGASAAPAAATAATSSGSAAQHGATAAVECGGDVQGSAPAVSGDGGISARHGEVNSIDSGGVNGEGGVGRGSGTSGADAGSSGRQDGGGRGGGSGGGGGGGDRRRGRITHVDQLWESCGRSRTALQVDERFNAVRVQQMIGKLCSSSSAQWLPLYEGVAAVMTSRCDEMRDELAAAARSAVMATAATAVAHADHTGSASVPAKQQRQDAASGGGHNRGRSQQLLFRGEVVYGGSSYADRFAELLRRGDTRGALALGAMKWSAAAENASGGGAGGSGSVCEEDDVQGELDEPEMREVVMVVDEQDNDHGRVGPVSTIPEEPPGLVAEGILLWRRLLGAWAVYRRWLEVWVVWCGPLGARVEAERQLAGAAAAHGEAPLAPPHLTNKGLLLFRSQVLLAFPVRRPLQAAALWLSARAARAEEYGGGGGTSLMSGAGGGGVGLSEEHGQLLTDIRKVLTELAVSDDVTQPQHLHTRQKLQRCFGGLLLRPVPGGTRALQLAQRMQGFRGSSGAGC